jgi:hypothetical protein
MARAFRLSSRRCDDVMARALAVEARIGRPNNHDDPNWIRGLVERMRKFASRRAISRDRRAEERAKNLACRRRNLPSVAGSNEWDC